MPIFKRLKSIVERVDTSTGMDLGINKDYLLLLVPIGEEDLTQGEFVAIKGRKEAYNYLKTHVANGNYNILNSFILSGGITFGNEVSIYTFMRLCIENYQYDYPDELAYIGDMCVNTALNPDSITDEYLDRFYAEEISAKAK